MTTQVRPSILFYIPLSQFGSRPSISDRPHAPEQALTHARFPYPTRQHDKYRPSSSEYAGEPRLPSSCSRTAPATDANIIPLGRRRVIGTPRASSKYGMGEVMAEGIGVIINTAWLKQESTT
jgi:hypothetical protein